MHSKAVVFPKIYQLPELSEEVLNALISIYPFPEGIERNLANFNREMIKKMPKTDLHVHGEAGFLIDETLARDLAKRNNIDFPEELFGEDSLFKYRGKDNFFQFLEDFLTISKLIRTPRDVEDIAFAFYKNCYENNVIYALPGISWFQCKEKMTFFEFIAAYHRALERGLKEFGAVSILQLRYYLERHLKIEDFDEIFKALLDHPQGLITTVGLAGAEEGYPLENFSPYYEKIKKERTQNGAWFFLTAHMEAFSSHETIQKSLQLLDWIAHGRRITEDNAVMEIVKNSKHMLELCPLSDVCVYPGEFKELSNHHSLKTLLKEGLISLNSDDPSMFGTIDKVYQQVYESLNVSFSDLMHCTYRGIQPASRESLQEMCKFQKEACEDYMHIQDCGALKIQFFQLYWQMLPQLIDLDEYLTTNILKIDLKTSKEHLNTLKNQIPINHDARKSMGELMRLKDSMNTATIKVLAKMEQSIEQVLEFNPQNKCGLC